MADPTTTTTTCKDCGFPLSASEYKFNHSDDGQCYARTEMAGERDRCAVRTIRRLRAEIGSPPSGSHPDEQKPRAETWHKERQNWIAEMDRTRADLDEARAGVVRDEAVTSAHVEELRQAFARAKAVMVGEIDEARGKLAEVEREHTEVVRLLGESTAQAIREKLEAERRESQALRMLQGASASNGAEMVAVLAKLAAATSRATEAERGRAEAEEERLTLRGTLNTFASTTAIWFREIAPMLGGRFSDKAKQWAEDADAIAREAIAPADLARLQSQANRGERK